MKKVIRLSENDIEGLVKKIIREEKSGDLKKACWKGYEAVGMKVKNGKKVPNCVPIKENHEGESNNYMFWQNLETIKQDTIKEEIYHIFEAKKTKEDDVCFLTFQKGMKN